MLKTFPPVLDPCCGGRMFYYDKTDPRVLFADIRQEKHILCDGRIFTVSPDTIADFRALPYADETFYLIVFDPPHLKICGPQSWQGKKYGKFSRDTWRDDLAKGFDECWRVLRTNGTLIFKWAETQIPLREILSCFSVSPLFGHTTTHNLKTHWIVFYKAVSGAWRLRPDERHKNNTPPEENEIMSDDILARLEDKLSTATPCVRTEYATVLKTEIAQAYRRAVLGVTRRHAGDLCLNTEEREALNNFQ